MFTPMQQHPQPRDAEFAPLLFSLSNLDQVTPRAQTPGRTTTENSRGGSMSYSQRRSGTPGSTTHGESTPQPPPMDRLTDDVMMEDSSFARNLRSTPPGGQRPQQQQPQPLSTAYGSYSQPQPYDSASLAVAAGSSSYAQQYDDTWVTVYGFPQSDLNSVLADFSVCGDIVKWSTFGQPAPNFVHLQYQNKYGAQRALQRAGQQLSSGLLIGVKPLDIKHRQAMESEQSGSQPQAPVVQQQKDTLARPYRVDMAGMAGRTGGQHQQQQLPQPSRSFMNKVVEFVFGM